jgi:LacI family gluconate utilization system Gnt-I transcriptional repressor
MPPTDFEPQTAPTLSAVAERAGVSAITVSRVVRLPEMVAPQTRAKVEAAMRELGYVPNQLAGALAGARTKSVGVLVPTIANSIFADTVQGLSDELEPLGYAVILAQSRYDADREDHMLSALLSRRPEAIIMVGSPATEDGARLLRRAGIPIVETWELPDEPIDAVAGFDNYAAGVAVAQHLVAQGRKHLAFIGGDAAVERIQRHRAARRREPAAPADPGAQCERQPGRARGIARRGCRVRRQ